MLLRFAPVIPGVLRTAVADVVRKTAGGGLASDFEAARGDGDFGRAAAPLALGARNGDAVRDTTGGVPALDGGLLGLLTVGLSQDEKKSSSGSPAGVEVPSAAGVAKSVTTTSPGNLCRISLCFYNDVDSEYSDASLAALLFSSSLYFVAAFEVYFVFGSLLASAAVPPFDWKNLVADSFPPIFIVRS